MRGTLLLAILSTRSSYAQEIEDPIDGPSDVPDTLQWWITPEVTWRIRTYALDHDIHTHEMHGLADAIRLAPANNEKNYGDIIAAQHQFDFADCTDKSETDAALSEAGLTPRLEVALGQFAFWKPDDAKYRTQSTPR
ncbi:MAG TPA: hypothetical protein VFE34_08610 [Dongiaceae bacterium]|nr:hypothetical protein [Dongiaceae bacterium]